MKKNFKLLFEPLDDGDIKFYLPDARLILYDDLKPEKISSLSDELLWNDKSYFFLLYPVDSKYSGHWVVLTRFNDTIEYFCSYGYKPDYPLKWSKQKQKGYLLPLLEKDKLNVEYNNIEFQNKKIKNMSTCGCYAVFRVLTMLELGCDLKHNNILIQQLKKDNPTMTYDDIIVQWINKR